MIKWPAQDWDFISQSTRDSASLTLWLHAGFFYFYLFIFFREASVPGETAGSGRERWGNAGIRGVPEAKRCAVDTGVRLHPNLCATTWGAGDGFTSTKIHCPRVTSKHQYQCKIENDLFYIYELLIFFNVERQLLWIIVRQVWIAIFKNTRKKFLCFSRLRQL